MTLESTQATSLCGDSVGQNGLVSPVADIGWPWRGGEVFAFRQLRVDGRPLGKSWRSRGHLNRRMRSDIYEYR